ncbi:hypothetical protein BGX26_005128, partial [Mortierella sp. AD094]
MSKRKIVETLPGSDYFLGLGSPQDLSPKGYVAHRRQETPDVRDSELVNEWQEWSNKLGEKPIKNHKVLISKCHSAFIYIFRPARFGPFTLTSFLVASVFHSVTFASIFITTDLFSVIFTIVAHINPEPVVFRVVVLHKFYKKLTYCCFISHEE